MDLVILKYFFLSLDLQQKIIYIYISYSSALAGFDTISIFKQSFIGLNLEFPVFLIGYHTKVNAQSALHFTTNWRGIIGFLLFPWILALWEMQTASSRIWTRFVVSIFNKGKHYPRSLHICMCVSECAYVCICVCDIFNRMLHWLFNLKSILIILGLFYA